jgi:peptidoglycan/xylan/chitin deacetylase (PgdA/CDA1 family)
MFWEPKLTLPHKGPSMLLRAGGLAGTFHVPLIGYDGCRTFDPGHLKSLAYEGFEIGAHGTSHNALPHLGPKEIAHEVRISKSCLEEMLGQRVRMFCYPKGRFNVSVIAHVKQAGYEGVRTTRMLRQKLDFDPFQMPTSLLAYPKQWKLYARILVRGQNLRRLFNYLTQFIRARSGLAIGDVLFDQVLKEGEVWQLHGHSWEIEELGLWDEVRQMLDYVSNREGVTYVSNGGVLNFLPANRAPVLGNHRIPSK